MSVTSETVVHVKRTFNKKEDILNIKEVSRRNAIIFKSHEVSQNDAKDYVPCYREYFIGLVHFDGLLAKLLVSSESYDEPTKIKATLTTEKSSTSTDLNSIKEVYHHQLNKEVKASINRSYFSASIKEDLLRAFLDDKVKLQVSFHLTFDSSRVTETIPKIIQDRLDLLDSGNYSDFTIIVGEANIKAHKCILAQQSEYFRAMFECGMKEATNSEMVVKDFSSAVVSTALRFLYTGCMHKSFNHCRAVELLPLADMYQLSNLEEVCIKEIKKDVTPGNVSTILSLAVDLNKEELKDSAFSFLKTMSEKDRWKILNGFDDSLRDDFVTSL